MSNRRKLEAASMIATFAALAGGVMPDADRPMRIQFDMFGGKQTDKPVDQKKKNKRKAARKARRKNRK